MASAGRGRSGDPGRKCMLRNEAPLVPLPHKDGHQESSCTKITEDKIEPPFGVFRTSSTVDRSGWCDRRLRNSVSQPAVQILPIPLSS